MDVGTAAAARYAVADGDITTVGGGLGLPERTLRVRSGGQGRRGPFPVTSRGAHPR